jgi:hypothetical protein
MLIDALILSKIMKKTKLTIACCFCSLISLAQINQNQGEKFKFGVVFGLTQPAVLKGFNFELNYFTKHFVFDYSHGFNLLFQNNLLTAEEKRQHLKFRVSHSLGFGVGYRITRNLNVRIEPKVHLWNIHQDTEGYSKSNLLKKYATYTLGLGTYYRIQPFRKSDNLMNGLTIVPSFRWWPNIHSTLKNNRFEYNNLITGKTETHLAKNIGVANTPFFGNISLGYSF